MREFPIIGNLYLLNVTLSLRKDLTDLQANSTLRSYFRKLYALWFIYICRCLLSSNNGKDNYDEPMALCLDAEVFLFFPRISFMFWCFPFAILSGNVEAQENENIEKKNIEYRKSWPDMHSFYSFLFDRFRRPSPAQSFFSVRSTKIWRGKKRNIGRACGRALWANVRTC